MADDPESRQFVADQRLPADEDAENDAGDEDGSESQQAPPLVGEGDDCETLSRFRADGTSACQMRTSCQTGNAGLKLTGERVVTPEGGFNPTWQRHVAAYRLSEPFLGPESVVDLGCGIGHSYHLLSPRVTIGIDIDPGALEGQQRETVVADMRSVPLDDENFTSVLSVHSIEHVPDPETVISEVARLLKPEGTAIFVTPNRLTFGRPDEIIDPFHHIEFDQHQLKTLCRAGFDEVEIQGIFGSDRYMEIFDEERATLDRLLRLDPLKVRKLLTMKMKQRLYDSLLARFRKDEDPRAGDITPDDFYLSGENLDSALDLIAVCRGKKA